MNELIRQFALEARLMSEEVPEWMCDGDKEKIQKFAELIINEYSDFISRNELAGPAVVQLTENYFGIE